MSIDGAKFGAEFKAWETNENLNPNLKGKARARAYGRAALDIQNQVTVFNPVTGKIETVHRNQVKDLFNVRQFNQEIGIGRARSYSQVQQYARDYEQLLLRRDALRNAELINQPFRTSASQIDAGLGIGRQGYVPMGAAKVKIGNVPFKPQTLNLDVAGLRLADDFAPKVTRNLPVKYQGGGNLPAVIDDIDLTKVKPNKFGQFFKGKGKYAAGALALFAAGAGIYSLCKKDDKEELAPVIDKSKQPETTPVVTEPEKETTETTETTTAVVPPVVEENPEKTVTEEVAAAVVVEDNVAEETTEPKVAPNAGKETKKVEEVAEEETVAAASAEDKKTETTEAEDESVKTTEVKDLPDEKDEPAITQEEEPIEEPIGLLNRFGGMTVAEMKGEIKENKVENKYLRREIALSKAYEKRIGAPNEEKPSIEEMQSQIEFNKQENELLRAEIKNVQRVERQERKLERMAQQNIRKLERNAQATEKRLLKAAEKARKSGLEVNENKLQADISGLQKTTKQETTQIRKQTEKAIEQTRLQLTA